MVAEEGQSVDLGGRRIIRSEEHTSELQSHDNLVCRLLLEKTEGKTLVAACDRMRSALRARAVGRRGPAAAHHLGPQGCPCFQQWTRLHWIVVFFFKAGGPPGTSTSPRKSPVPF